jgi:cytochrome c-type biogenesis protein CcmH
MINLALWGLLGMMTAGAIVAVWWPLGRTASSSVEDGDCAIYREQLDEISRDRAAGTIGEAEATAARSEVSRRLIAALEANGQSIQCDISPPGRRRLARKAILCGLPASALGLYLTIGSPELPGAPLAARIAARSEPSVAELLAQVETRLQQHPEDGRGWEVVTPVYMRLGRYADAANAMRNAVRLLGATADRKARLGEALVAAANGIVTTEAKAEFDRALHLDSHQVVGRFYEGLAAEQDGRREDAARQWRALLADAPPEAPWIRSVQRALARIEPSAGADTSAPDGDAPGQSETAQRMIRGMVDRLAGRLAQDGSDLEGWLRLMRSYQVLGEPQHVQSAVSDARRALANDPEKLRRLEDRVKKLGIEEQDR